MNEVCERCAVADVQSKLIGKLSKGYRQRVGLAQAIIHNPDVLILDEPTAGLDPKQINETRDLISSLAGDHTIILSTHILPEVEQTCEQVHHHQQGQAGGDGFGAQPAAIARAAPSRCWWKWRAAMARSIPAAVQQPAGTECRASAACSSKNPTTIALSFEVESLKDRVIRGDLARAVVEAGWNLNELQPVGHEPGRNLPAVDRRRAAARQQPGEAAAKEMNNEKHLDHLPQGTEQLLSSRRSRICC